MNTLLTAIKNDLECLYTLDFLKSAQKLNEILNKPFFSDKKPPMYFTGKFDAKTVFVMLNPGSNIDEFFSFERSQKKKYESLDSYNEKYLFDHINYGKIDYLRKDNFDLKQASFLYEFENSGLDLPDFFSDFGNKKLQLDAKEAVLMNKLQLELIPYCSVNFDNIIDNRKQANDVIEAFIPHINRVLDAIISFERKYVIFGAQKFAFLLEAYEFKRPGTVVFSKRQTALIKDLKNQVSWQTVSIKHNSKIINGIIPNSFPRRELPNAHKKMRQYGKLCFESFLDHFGNQ